MEKLLLLHCHSPMASSSFAEFSATNSCISTKSFPEHLMHKNRLQEFAQRSKIALPVYQTINEGQPLAPKFRSTVLVDGMSYASQSTFSQRKIAEQEAARLALECLSKRSRDEGSSLVREISKFCKSILNEYAAKLNLERPTYNTVQREGLPPIFISSLVFNGRSFRGDVARRKKDAEQLAARAAIFSILGNSCKGTMLFEMIKSKSNAIKGKCLQDIHSSAVSPTVNTGHTSVKFCHKDTRVAGFVVVNNEETKVEFSKSSRMLYMLQEYQMLRHESSPEASMVSNVSQQLCSAHTNDDGSSSKRRRMN